MADEKTPSPHTPTPWGVSSLFIVCDAEAHILANCIHTGIPQLDIPFDERVANAAFIVKAANCHDELIAALRFCYATLSNVVHTEKRLQIEVDAIARARFALAKADASVEDVGER